MPISTDLLTQSFRLEKWVREKALPLWSTKGISAQLGAAAEKLDHTCEPDPVTARRTRVQARQILVFSAAAEMGWIEEGCRLVSGIDHFINSHAKTISNEPGYVHLVSSDGDIIDPKKDAYDYAFFILANAYKYKAFNDLNSLNTAYSLLHQIEYDFKAASGGWAEGDYQSQYRRQNPHMHLLEAFLTCYQFTQDGAWLAKAGQVFTLFETVFYQHQHQVLLEYFNHDWTLPTDNKAQIVEPGHMYEWIWLLRWYEKLTSTPVSHYCDALFKKAQQIGTEPGTNLIYDQVHISGAANLLTKRCWPVTEYIKACIAQAEASKFERHRYETLAAEGICMLFNYYFNRKVTGFKYNKNQDNPSGERHDTGVDEYTGSYIDKLDEENQVADNTAPASTLYHIFMATKVTFEYCRQVGR